MAIADLIIQYSEDDKIIAIDYLGDELEWFKELGSERFLNEKLFDAFGDIKNHDILELNTKLFKVQFVKLGTQKQLLLSQDSLMLSLFKETIDKVSEGIQIFDRNGYFIHGNPASEALEGYDTIDFKGKHLLDLYDLSEEMSTTLSVIRTKKPVINRCDRFQAKNNKELVTINSGFPLMIQDEIYGACAFESDLSVINNIKNRSFNLEAFIRNEQPVLNQNMYTFKKIIHQSEKMAECIRFAKKIALTHVNVMITGETGTGKEMFAQSIHNFSPRADKPFVDVNCSAVPSNLVESLFFGTEKGAFTGSMTKKGFFELAEGGTLFLDEINAMSMEMQAKLLRVLQEKRYQRIGGSQYHQCNVRVITACNEDPQSLIDQQMMRKDFYYRISALSVHIPPLKDRKEDIAMLAAHFAQRLCEEYGKPNLTLTPDMLDILTHHDWPGNVRELRHVIEHAVHQANVEEQVFSLAHFPVYLTKGVSVIHTAISDSADGHSIPQLPPQSQTLNDLLDAYEQNVVREALNRCNGNISRAAKSLGLSRQNLQYRIRKFEALSHEQDQEQT
ncbi:sigma-54 interaction domain-containing protein [Acidaminobacter hydrogenoformans]|uniref:Arginine utilization regulatory protein n=1 Tax=Acidaminobacter hydrogenoformans DSM 2784 TaxID=1120920 RepID=A0A1G5S1E1_9FIRM|nr:sigma 54-interacting transcriptional regulator [Acidaminobacter hydrogenoformans]SCZ80205.1 arginine utilization regulatory protein [Acidaminobacter hydrogenoformans DSM 2784]